MDGKRLIRSLKLTNFLSFGPEGEEVELEPLNVLIGPNASGKSNFIEAIELLHATPRNLSEAIARAGGAAELIWKGEGREAVGRIEVVVDSPLGPLAHHLAFEQNEYGYGIVSESVRPASRSEGSELPPFYYELRPGEREAKEYMRDGGHGPPAKDKDEKWSQSPVHLSKPAESVLSQRRSLDIYPAVTYLAEAYERIALHREANLGSAAAVRGPSQANMPHEFLAADASNLPLVLNNIRKHPGSWELVTKKLKRFYRGLENVGVKVEAGRFQVFFRERGLERPVPGTRLSDGTLRWLCLLAILCHPEPPPLVVIEEPELGLHPDALGAVAELLIDASQRMQIIVTTHSDLLVSDLGDVPEAVIVCERDDDGSHLRRLSRDRLKEWLEKYPLGELWLMGEIGGTS